MAHKTTKHVVALFLTIVMMLGVIPMTAFAAEAEATNEVIYENGKFGYNGYYNVEIYFGGNDYIKRIKIPNSAKSIVI